MRILLLMLVLVSVAVAGCERWEFKIEPPRFHDDLDQRP